MASRQAVLNALRKEQGLARQRVGRARKITVPVPVGGLNTRDSDTRIGVQFAQKFTNMISSRDGVRARKTPIIYASISASVEPETMMTHVATDGTETMFCGAASKIWDVTAGGFIDTPTSVSGLGNTTLVHANVNGRLVWANGTDDPQAYDGSVWSVQPLSVAPGEPAVSVDKFSGLFTFKNRVYWWQPDQMGFYYSTLDTIGDALKFFDLSYVAREGGDLLTITRYTQDGGSGPDDYPVFVTSRGEAIIYQGTNPNSAADWAFVGSFRIGKPPKVTSAIRPAQVADVFGAQSWLITDQDYVALPQALLTEGIVKPTMLAGALQTAMSAYSDQPGWQALFYPEGPWLLFNVPAGGSDPVKYNQHVVDLHTGSASKFTGMNGRSWSIYNRKLYYGGQVSSSASSVKIFEAFTTTTPVSIELLPGATNFGRNSSKALTAYRIWASTSAGDVLQTSATSEIRTDYTDSANDTSQHLRWNEWILAGGVGTYIQTEVIGMIEPNVEIKHIDYLYEDGDPVLRFRDQ